MKVSIAQKFGGSIRAQMHTKRQLKLLRHLKQVLVEHGSCRRLQGKYQVLSRGAGRSALQGNKAALSPYLDSHLLLEVTDRETFCLRVHTVFSLVLTGHQKPSECAAAVAFQHSTERPRTIMEEALGLLMTLY